MKQTVTLEIAGAKYRMTSDAEGRHLERLASLVNDRVTALGPKAARSASPAQLLAVVALGLADDLQAADARCRKLEETAKSAIGRAVARIDRRLAEAPTDRDA
ncbi:MAG: cell division protein ZapA [Myxococcales bacterium]|nr:cell division protein ZapA [Myxococcales bacterium]